jgi:glutamine amidotransferase
MKVVNKKRITIINYGMGNLQSLQNALAHLDVESKVTSNPEEIKVADALILPGVGSFGQAMRNIKKDGLNEVILETTKCRGIPFLGICLGMQLLADSGEEDGSNAGLGLIPGKVVELQLSGMRLPHIGFNSVRSKKANQDIFENIDENSDFYFIHKFHFKCIDDSNILGVTEYGGEFVSAIKKENIFGVQFHPEKSQSNGLILLNNFIKISKSL